METQLDTEMTTIRSFLTLKMFIGDSGSLKNPKGYPMSTISKLLELNITEVRKVIRITSAEIIIDKSYKEMNIQILVKRLKELRDLKLAKEVEK